MLLNGRNDGSGLGYLLALANRPRQAPVVQEQIKVAEKPAAPSVDPVAAARAAVMSRIREQQQQGVRPTFSGDGITVTQRPTGGAIVQYPDKRVVTSRYGTGASSPTKKGPTTIEGVPAAKWFADAAKRQGQRIVVGGYDKGSIFEPA